MPTKTTSSTKYYKVVGSEEQPDDKFLHKLREVGDKAGNPLSGGPAPMYEQHISNTEVPRGTVIKVEETYTRTVTLNPTT